MPFLQTIEFIRKLRSPKRIAIEEKIVVYADKLIEGFK